MSEKVLTLPKNPLSSLIFIIIIRICVFTSTTYFCIDTVISDRQVCSEIRNNLIGWKNISAAGASEPEDS